MKKQNKYNLTNHSFFVSFFTEIEFVEFYVVARTDLKNYDVFCGFNFKNHGAGDRTFGRDGIKLAGNLHRRLIFSFQFQVDNRE